MRFSETMLQLGAALAYGVGGSCMKLSDGLRRPIPTAGLYALFILGATLQTIAMRRTDLGVSYILVLGFEAIVAFGLAIFLFGETVAPLKAVAVLLILIGVVLLY
jgi:quaternary ammonium compound-resistance protein SugE